MELVIGLVVGLVLGIFCSLIPGFNMGLGYLLAPFIPGPRFAIGILIGIDITSSSLKHLSLLHSKHREDIDENITQDTNKAELMYTSMMSYLMMKAAWYGALGFAILTQGTNILDIELVRQLSAVLGMGLWILLIYASKDWKVAAIGLGFYIVFTLLIVELPIQRPIFVLASSLFSVNLINEFRYKPEKIENAEYVNPKEFKFSGLWAGLVSGFLWGLPTNAVCRLLQEENESPSATVSRHAIADAVASATGLGLLLTLGRSSNAVAFSIPSIKEVFSSAECFWLLTTLGVFNIILIYWWGDITNIYVSIHNKTPHFVLRLIILLTVGSLTMLFNGWFFVIALIGLILNKILKIAEAPRELAWSPIGILALVKLFI
jgi:hypothetical protein